MTQSGPPVQTGSIEHGGRSLKSRKLESISYSVRAAWNACWDGVIFFELNVQFCLIMQPTKYANSSVRSALIIYVLVHVLISRTSLGTLLHILLVILKMSVKAETCSES
jgi:hypothetical protein